MSTFDYPTVGAFDEPNQTICPQDWLNWNRLIWNMATLLSPYPSQIERLAVGSLPQIEIPSSTLIECLPLKTGSRYTEEDDLVNFGDVCLP